MDLMLLMFMMDVREASKLFAGARICRVLQDLKILVVVVQSHFHVKPNICYVNNDNNINIYF